MSIWRDKCHIFVGEKFIDRLKYFTHICVKKYTKTPRDGSSDIIDMRLMNQHKVLFLLSDGKNMVDEKLI